jgi:hypothetical protein
MAQWDSGAANNRLAAACSNLLHMESKATEQGEVIAPEGQKPKSN